MQTETDHGPKLIAVMIGAYFFGLFVMDTGTRFFMRVLEVFGVGKSNAKAITVKACAMRIGRLW